MPSTVKVRVKAARNLPLPDSRTNNSSVLPGLPGRDPYVVVSLGGHASSIAMSADEEPLVRKSRPFSFSAASSSSAGYTVKTKVCRRTISPVWDEEFRFDVSDDTILQDEPLIFKVCDADHPTLSGSVISSTLSNTSGGPASGISSSNISSTSHDESIGVVYIFHRTGGLFVCHLLYITKT